MDRKRSVDCIALLSFVVASIGDDTTISNSNFSILITWSFLFSAAILHSTKCTRQFAKHDLLDAKENVCILRATAKVVWTRFSCRRKFAFCSFNIIHSRRVSSTFFFLYASKMFERFLIFLSILNISGSIISICGRIFCNLILFSLSSRLMLLTQNKGKLQSSLVEILYYLIE